MRQLTSHKINQVNDHITVKVLDAPGHGGACHDYVISYANKSVDILFQNGPIKEVGVNGITHEALLAILMDRLEHFQKGKYACEENETALQYLKAAQEILLSRTKKRVARGVEGTHAV